ncbi:MAG: cache domain-containing protein [Deltaproteobacteria bacterium]|nr:cache domain-containing protein [Candidatus Zymogenaceae bacterium]
MKLNVFRSLAALITILSLTAAAIAAESATPEEVIAKVKEAASYIAANGDSVLPEFNDPEGPWVWKDTYVFVMDCPNDRYAGHPMASVMDTKISEIVDYAGNRVGLTECRMSEENPKGAWVEIMWPQLGQTTPERKICYVLKLRGLSYTVGSGIYEPTMTMEELNALIK